MANEPATTAMDRMEMFHESMIRRARDEMETRGATLADEIAAQNMDAIFSAIENPEATEQDIWNAGTGGTIQGRDAVGLELRFYSFRPTISTREDIEGGHGYYITCDCVVLGGPQEVLTRLALRPGQEIAFQTGSQDFAFRLRAFEMRAMLPIDGVVTGVRTQTGNVVLKLTQMPVRAMAGTVES